MPNKPSKLYKKIDELRQKVGFPHIPEDTRTIGERMKAGILSQKIGTGIKKVKENYQYFKEGVKADEMQDKTARAKANIQMVRDSGNNEMADRMEEEYKKGKKEGTY